MKKLKALLQTVRARKNALVAGASAVAVTFMGAEAVTAMGVVSGDSTFNDATSLLTEWSTGSFGKLASVAALLVGIAMGIIRGTIVAVVGAVAIAIALYMGPGILDGIFSAGIPATLGAL